jgi:hypothetical protein
MNKKPAALYECETQQLTFMKQHELQMFQNKKILTFLSTKYFNTQCKCSNASFKRKCCQKYLGLRRLK